jgi:phenylacetate-CoA ligase
MTNYYDKLETRPQESREQWQLERLPRQLAHAKARAPAFSRILEKIDPAAIKTRAALRDIPITRKSDLLSLQNASRPFGGFAAAQWGEARARVRLTRTAIRARGSRSRPLADRARALRRGLSPWELVHNLLQLPLHSCRIDDGDRCARARLHRISRRHWTDGNAGTGDGRFAARRYVGTPSFLKIILEKGDEMGVKLERLRKALVSRRTVSKQPPGLASCARHRRLSALCYGGCRRHRL